MKVYVVCCLEEYEYGDATAIGVFSSEELAKECCANMAHPGYYNIAPLELDAPAIARKTTVYGVTLNLIGKVVGTDTTVVDILPGARTRIQTWENGTVFAQSEVSAEHALQMAWDALNNWRLEHAPYFVPIST